MYLHISGSVTAVFFIIFTIIYYYLHTHIWCSNYAYFALHSLIIYKHNMYVSLVW